MSAHLALGDREDYVQAMVDAAEIHSIASSTATANLSAQVVKRVITRPTVDSQGNDALRVIIVIGPKAAAKVSGDDVLNTLVDIQQKLHAVGEDRLAIVEYTTEDELNNAGDQA